MSCHSQTPELECLPLGLHAYVYVNAEGLETASKGHGYLDYAGRTMSRPLRILTEKTSEKLDARL